MKRLFGVYNRYGKSVPYTVDGEKLPAPGITCKMALYFEHKSDAKQWRDHLNNQKHTGCPCTIGLGPDHWRYKS